MTETPFAGQKVIELVLDSGETVYVKPLSILHYHAFKMRVEQEYPYPDPKPYEKKMDDSKTLEPGEVLPATDNPVYVKLCADVDESRSTWLYRQYILLATEVIDQAAVIARHKKQIDTLRKIIDLPEDVWEATLLYAVIQSTADYNRILQATSNQLMVTEPEVANGWRIFRPRVRGQAIIGDSGKPEPSSVTTEQQTIPDNAGE